MTHQFENNRPDGLDPVSKLPVETTHPLDKIESFRLFESNDCPLWVEPLVKWPGGKRRLLSQIVPLLPEKFDRYYEPFLGGAALFFRLRPKWATLSDKNEEVINCYTMVRDNPDEVIRRLSRLRNSKDDYYQVRDSRPTSEIGRAVRFIYLTTLAFNGIYRVNKRGEFNVPYGNKTHLRPCDSNKIRSCSEALSGKSLQTLDFEEAVSSAKSGDLIYFDPPYTVAHGNNGFLKYNEKILQWEDQIRLARLAKSLADRGCHVLVSNADHSSVVELYSEFKTHRISRPSVMAASGEFRKTITECVFYN